MRWKPTYHWQDLLCGKYWNYLTKTSGFIIRLYQDNEPETRHARLPRVCRVTFDTYATCSRRWQRSFIFSEYNTACCCTCCDVRCGYMCCNKSRVICHIYKRQLIINIIVDTSASPGHYLQLKAGHRSTLRTCVFAFWHRASVYVRLSAFCLRIYAATKVRPVCVYVFENNACVRK